MLAGATVVVRCFGDTTVDGLFDPDSHGGRSTMATGSCQMGCRPGCVTGWKRQTGDFEVVVVGTTPTTGQESEEYQAGYQQRHTHSPCSRRVRP